ncbi:MAG: type II toxin-antitoxin system VapC family toxin [Leptospiraceae bacterium]|nr:type II toxin-antitoxin system VapC family toxin [Leptospiraceae bacterium]
MALCDTNILIEFWKGNPSVVTNLTKLSIENISISSVTQMELYYGALDKNELSKIKRALAALILIPISENISNFSVELIERYSKSHGLEIPDAIIAATAIQRNIKLYTLNKKDFKYIEDLHLF